MAAGEGVATAGGAGVGTAASGRARWEAAAGPGAASLEPPAAPSPRVRARPALLWQLAPLSRHQAAESSPLLRRKMLSLRRPSGASAFYCNRRHRLPFVNLLVCARGERPGAGRGAPGAGSRERGARSREPGAGGARAAEGAAEGAAAAAC